DVVLSSSALSALSLNAPPPAASYTLSLHDRSSDLMDSKPKGVRFDGDKGWIQLFDEGAMASDPPSLINAAKGLEGTYKVMAPHLRNFIDSVRTRKQTVSPPEVAQRAHTIVHCANLCLRLGRKLRWDPEAELFIGDD